VTARAPFAIMFSMDGIKKPKNVHAQILGRLGGVLGGKARAKAMSAEQRSASAAKAAEARWRKYRDESY